MKGLELVLDIDQLKIFEVIDHDHPAVETETKGLSVSSQDQLDLFETMGL
ncbi:hypothetical protein ACVR1G_08365 [Streptococcus dentasini]